MKMYVIITAILFTSCLWISPVVAGTAQQQMAEMAAMAGGDGVVQGSEGWLFLQEELEHLASEGFYGDAVRASSKASKEEFKDPFPAIVDFNQQLKERGIELILMPIPPKALIYPQHLPVKLGATAIAELEAPYTDLYAQLRQQGVTVLDLIPIYRSASGKEQLYCRTDSHFSGSGLEIASDELAKIIKKSEWYSNVGKAEYVTEQRSVSILGDLTLMQKKDDREDITLEFVTDLQTGKAPMVKPESPVLLLGDSHTLVFSVGGDLHATGAGLAEQLSAELGEGLDRMGVRGSGSTASRIKVYQRSRKDEAFLQQKKVIIWCLSARELTGSGGWRKIPVAKNK